MAITRSELAETLQAMGANVTERTLRFWETQHLLPKANRGVYTSDDIVDAAFAVAVLRGRLARGYSIYTKGYTITVIDGQIITTKHMKED